jgi:hypothetical protein
MKNKTSGTVSRSVATTTTTTTLFSNVRRARGQSRTAGRSAHCRGVGSQSSIGRDRCRVDAGIARGSPIGFAVRRRHGCSVVLRFDFLSCFRPTVILSDVHSARVIFSSDCHFFLVKARLCAIACRVRRYSYFRHFYLFCEESALINGFMSPGVSAVVNDDVTMSQKRRCCVRSHHGEGGDFFCLGYASICEG